jgi:hypothetical protein
MREKKSQTEARLARRSPISIANHLNVVPKNSKKRKGKEKKRKKEKKKKQTKPHTARFSSSEFSSLKPRGQISNCDAAGNSA